MEALDHPELLRRWRRNELTKREMWDIEPGDLHNMLDEASDQIDKMRGQVLEYRHALEEVTTVHDGQCPECAKVAQSALDRLNRHDFIEQAQEQ